MKNEAIVKTKRNFKKPSTKLSEYWTSTFFFSQIQLLPNSCTSSSTHHIHTHTNKWNYKFNL